MKIRDMKEQGCYVCDIAAHIGVSERTVRRALKRKGAPSKRRSGIRLSKLDPYKEQIDHLLSEGVWNAEVIFAQIRQQGYTGGISILRDYIRPKRVLRKARGTVRFETSPGKQLQSDWGKIATIVSHERRWVHFTVNTLGYSRRFHVWAASCEDAEHTYEGLIRSFEWFGGVPYEVWVDNQKAAVLSHSRSGRVRFNPGFAHLADHYGFIPRACRPYRPQTKGKDERMVRYVKENFFQRYRSFETLVHLNQQMEQWLKEVADLRVHGTVKEQVLKRFEQERSYLKPLPPIRFCVAYYERRKVALDAFIDVRGNRYSVPAHLCGDTVSIHLTLDGQLKIYEAGGTLVAEHLLKPLSQGWQVVPSHHARLWRDLGVVSRDLSSYEEAGTWN